MTRVRARSTKIWTAVAERSGETAFRTAGCVKSGVALRFPRSPKSVVAAQAALGPSVFIVTENSLAILDPLHFIGGWKVSSRCSSFSALPQP